MTEVLRYRDHHIQSEVQDADVLFKDLIKKLIMKLLDPLPTSELIRQVRKSENEEKLCKEKFGESSWCAVNPVTYWK